MRETVRGIWVLFLALLAPLGQAEEDIRALQANNQTDRFEGFEFAFEYRIFLKDNETTAVEDALAQYDTALMARLEAVLDDVPAVMLESVEAFPRGVCAEEAFTLNVFSRCFHAITSIRTLVDSSSATEEGYDNLQRALLAEVQFAADVYNVQEDTVQIVYDYPIYVQSTIGLTLEGVDRVMTDSEVEIFLRNFRIGFEPIMADGAYEWSSAQVVLQLSGKAEPVTRRSLQLTESNVTEFETDPKSYNKLSLMLRGVCAGGTCIDRNFQNFCLVNVLGFVDDFVALLQMVDSPEAILYFGRITGIYVDDSDVVAPLSPDGQVAIEEPADDGIPSWAWILLAINAFILLCVLGWVRYRIYRRREARKGAPEPAKEEVQQEQLSAEEEEEFMNQSEMESSPYIDEESNYNAEGMFSKEIYDSNYGPDDEMMEDFSDVGGSVDA